MRVYVCDKSVMWKITHTRTDFCGLVGSMRCVIRSCLSHKWFVMCAISIYYYHKQHTIIQQEDIALREKEQANI